MKKVIMIPVLLAFTGCVGHSNINQHKVFFAFDSADLTPDATHELKSQATYLKYNPDVNIVMAGHCDERGSTEYNLALGALRAGNAAHVILKEGIEPKRGTGEAVWAKNRNATTIVAPK